MPRLHANGLGLAYDRFGDPGNPTMLLVMGVGTQMIAWREGFCERLAVEGFHVVRFDNRDIGLSDRVPDAPAPNLVSSALKRRLGLPLTPAYSLSDMAEDAFGLLDALGVESAHVVGASMGGMIGQLMAIERPGRLRSLCSLMSSTSARHLPGPSPRVHRLMLRRQPLDPQEMVAHQLETLAAVGSRGHIDWDDARRYFERVVARDADRSGVSRQMEAVLAAPDRTGALAGLRVPAVVIHGAEDPLLPPAHGEATARAIPGARLELVLGMGHDLPRSFWPVLLAAIVGNAHRADAARAAAA